jgi:hypothetical protein
VKTKSITINEKTGETVSVPASALETGRLLGMTPVQVAKAHLSEMRKAYAAERTLSGAHRDRDVRMGIYKAGVKLSVADATRTHRITSAIADRVALASAVSALDPSTRKLLGLADSNETTDETTAVLSDETTTETTETVESN